MSSASTHDLATIRARIERRKLESAQLLVDVLARPLTPVLPFSADELHAEMRTLNLELAVARHGSLAPSIGAVRAAELRAARDARWVFLAPAFFYVYCELFRSSKDVMLGSLNHVANRRRAFKGGIGWTYSGKDAAFMRNMVDRADPAFRSMSAFLRSTALGRALDKEHRRSRLNWAGVATRIWADKYGVMPAQRPVFGSVPYDQSYLWSIANDVQPLRESAVANVVNGLEDVLWIIQSHAHNRVPGQVLTSAEIVRTAMDLASVNRSVLPKILRREERFRNEFGASGILESFEALAGVIDWTSASNDSIAPQITHAALSNGSWDPPGNCLGLRAFRPPHTEDRKWASEVNALAIPALGDRISPVVMLTQLGVVVADDLQMLGGPLQLSAATPRTSSIERSQGL